MRVYLEYWQKRKTHVFRMKLLLSYVIDCILLKWWMRNGRCCILLLEICRAVVQICSKLDLGIFKVGFFQLPVTRWTCIASIVHLTFNSLLMCCPATFPSSSYLHKRTVCWHLILENTSIQTYLDEPMQTHLIFIYYILYFHNPSIHLLNHSLKIIYAKLIKLDIV